MIIIITGQQGEGKTTWVLSLLHLLNMEFYQVGGIYSKGTWKEGMRDRFEVVDIENGSTRLLCDHVDRGSDIPFRHFYFKPDGIDHGLNALQKVKSTHPDILILDEVGGLELEGKGWSPFLDALGEHYQGVVVVVVREALVESVRERWNLAGSLIFRCTEWGPEQVFQRIKSVLTGGSKTQDMPVTGIILAGGRSRRLGMDKGLLRFRNKQLVEIAIERFKKICDQILISSNSVIYEGFNLPVVPDSAKDCGPMMGIYSCLKESPTPLNLVVSVDTPLVPAGLYREMIRILKNEQVIVPDHGGGHFEPLIGLYTRDLIPLMETFFRQNRYALPDMFKQARFKGLAVGPFFPFSNPLMFMNINTTADLAYLEYLDQQSGTVNQQSHGIV